MATAPNHWSKRLAPRTAGPHTPRAPLSPELLAALWARATDRDRWILRLLHEHRVLTTTQITALAFDGPRVTRARLQMLHLHRAVFRNRPRTGSGSLPWHWVLDEAGARLLAADDGLEPKEWGWRRDHATALLSAHTLAHTVGANWIGVDLVAHTRTTPRARLLAWWGEHRCAQVVGDYVRPDGYAHYTDSGGDIEFFLEYDTGTEPHKTVLAKIDKYARLAEATGIDLPVLLILPNPRRETALHRLTADTPVRLATTTPDALHTAGGATGACWQPAGHTGPRRHLTHLAAAPGHRPTQPPLHTSPAARTRRPAPDPTPPRPAPHGWAA